MFDDACSTSLPGRSKHTPWPPGRKTASNFVASTSPSARLLVIMLMAWRGRRDRRPSC